MSHKNVLRGWQSQKSTHSPYTTLFRSDHLVNLGSNTVLNLRVAGEFVKQPGQRHRRGFAAGGEQNEHLVEDLDRKSTRLNSSHVESSYAVFCLKKNQFCSR